MPEVVSLKISSRVAQYVRRGATRELKEEGLALAPGFEPVDHLMLLFCLVNDPEPAIRQAARQLFYQLSDDVIITFLDSPGVHPGVRELIVRVHGTRPSLSHVLAADLHSTDVQASPEPEPGNLPAVPSETELDSTKDINPDELELQPETEEDSPEDDAEVDPESEEFLSKYRMAQMMGIGEKIKMALTGDKEWRSLLIKDSNKLVSGSVVKNPRITDGEILTILKVGVQNDEIVRVICANKEWIKKYKIRKALVDCPKTPIANSLRYMATLDIKDIAGYAKSKNISSVLSTQAKRLVLAKKQ